MFNIFNNNKPQNKISEKDRIKGALFGFFVGDALGVPVEFINREELRKNHELYINLCESISKVLKK